MTSTLFDLGHAVTNPPTPVDWLVDGCIPGASVGAIVGRSGSLKTWIAMHIAFCIAQGTQVAPGLLASQGWVYFVDFESGSRRLQERARKLAPALPTLRVAVSSMQGNYLSGSFVADFESHMKTWSGPPKLVVVDTFLAACPGVDENSSLIRSYIDPLKELAERHKTTFLLVHHSGKGGAHGLDAARGSSAFGDAVDWMLEATTTNGGVNLSLVKDRDGALRDRFFVEITGEPGNFIAMRETSLAMDEHERLGILNVLKIGPMKLAEIAARLRRRKTDVGKILSRMVESGVIVHQRGVGYGLPHMLEFPVVGSGSE